MEILLKEISHSTFDTGINKETFMRSLQIYKIFLPQSYYSAAHYLVWNLETTIAI